VDKVALGQVFLPVIQFYPVTIFPPILHTHFHLACMLLLNEEKTGDVWEPSKCIGEHRTEKYFFFFRMLTKFGLIQCRSSYRGGQYMANTLHDEN
jgi:hypothetical protein